MREPRVVGLDLSLTATGVAWPAGETGTLTPTRTGMARLADLRDRILAICDPGIGVEGVADLVAVEGYSFGSRHSQAHALGELGGVVRLALWEAGVPFVDVAPALLKKYATGHGNAPKEQVLAAAIRRLGYQGHDHNQADAAWLRAVALDAYGHPPTAMPEAHRQALAKVAWPELRTAVPA
jgi:Holliday junction resolvasome RuvABC endonuclease subunit